MRQIAWLLFQTFILLPAFAQEAETSEPGAEDSVLKDIHLSSTPNIKANNIFLKWNTIGREGFYIIERSIDLKDFEAIGVIKSHRVDSSVSFTDEKPFVKRNYYRIKWQAGADKSFYSDTITAGTTNGVFCKFYPNPVDKLLILRSEHSGAIKITDVTGKIRIMQQLKPGVQILDVSCLEKNIYLVVIFHEDANQFISQKLIKN